jgi:hypothetical protein
MSFTILVEAVNGQFAASLIGAPNVRVVKPNRAQAIAGLKAEIQQRVALGELLSVEIDAISVSDLAGSTAPIPHFARSAMRHISVATPSALNEV